MWFWHLPSTYMYIKYKDENQSNDTKTKDFRFELNLTSNNHEFITMSNLAAKNITNKKIRKILDTPNL